MMAAARAAAEEAMGHVPPRLPITTVLCPGCAGSGVRFTYQNVECLTCNGEGRISEHRLEQLTDIVAAWHYGGCKGESLVGIVQQTGFSQAYIDDIIAGLTMPAAASDSPAIDSTASAAEPPYPSEPTDTRPEIERFSLHTLSGKHVLKVTVIGSTHYASGVIVSNRDFLNDGLSLTNPPKMPPGPHKFRGTVRSALIDMQVADNQIKQNLEIVLTQHALIDSGHYKGKGVLKSTEVATVGYANTIANNVGTMQPASESLGRHKRKFSLE